VGFHRRHLRCWQKRRLLPPGLARCHPLGLRQHRRRVLPVPIHRRVRPYKLFLLWFLPNGPVEFRHRNSRLRLLAPSRHSTIYFPLFTLCICSHGLDMRLLWRLSCIKSQLLQAMFVAALLKRRSVTVVSLHGTKTKTRRSTARWRFTSFSSRSS
jgi:hypothetical protein